jgi:hypothetical protein
VNNRGGRDVLQHHTIGDVGILQALQGLVFMFGLFGAYHLFGVDALCIAPPSLCAAATVLRELAMPPVRPPPSAPVRSALSFTFIIVVVILNVVLFSFNPPFGILLLILLILRTLLQL